MRGFTNPLLFRLLISLESSRRSSHKKDSISEKKFRKGFHADVRKCTMPISADNFVMIHGKFLSLNSHFFISLLLLSIPHSHYFPDLLSSSGHPICVESVPQGKRQAVWVRRISSGRVICLLANKQLSGRWGEAVLTFFAYFFVSRQKSKWGLGQSPKKSIINW
jgi:hypothetical protein